MSKLVALDPDEEETELVTSGTDEGDEAGEQLYVEAAWWLFAMGFGLIAMVGLIYTMCWLGLYWTTGTPFILGLNATGPSGYVAQVLPPINNICPKHAAAPPSKIMPCATPPSGSSSPPAQPPAPAPGPGTSGKNNNNGATPTCASFAVIALNDTFSTKDSNALLTKLIKSYPLASYSLQTVAPLRLPPQDPNQMTAYVNNDLKPAMAALDQMVTALVGKKVSLIHLPTNALLVDAFLTGQFKFRDALNVQQTVSLFNARTLAQRYPNQRFSVSDVQAASIDATPNVRRFADVTSGFDASVVLPKISQLGARSDNDATAVYFVNQQGDLSSIEAFRNLALQLTSGANAWTWDRLYSFNVSVTGTTNAMTFSPGHVTDVVANIQSIVSQLSMAGSAKLVVVLNPSPQPAAQMSFAAAFDAAFTGLANADPRISFLGLNFAPRASAGAAGLSVGFPVHRGYQPLSVRPSLDLTALGLAEQEGTLQSQLKSDLFVLDAAKFAAGCAASELDSGVTGNAYRFAGNSLVAEFLQDQGTIAAGAGQSSAPDTGLRFNGAWSKRAAVPAK